MHADNFDLSRYLQRIGYGGEIRADAATLAALMRCQLVDADRILTTRAD